MIDMSGLFSGGTVIVNPSLPDAVARQGNGELAQKR